MFNRPVVHRVRLSDEDLQWIATALKSLSKAGRQGPRRRVYLQRLSERLYELPRGNPNLTLYGKLHP